VAHRLDFRDRDGLVAALTGVDTFFNTYWLRFPRGSQTYQGAVDESAILLDAAGRAGVRRFVHLSVVNADPAGPTAYVRAKARLEAMVRSSGIPFAIIRPTLTFGPNDILANNLAWALRRLPLFGIPRDGHYRLQPVHVDDVARLCLEAADGPDDVTHDAAGPEVLEYREMVGIVRTAIGSRAIVVPLPHRMILGASRLLGVVVGDVVITRDEIVELSTGFLASKEPPRGTIRFSEWVPANAAALGRSWSSELARNYAPIVLQEGVPGV
jgi:NADH dehydrogenase